MAASYNHVLHVLSKAPSDRTQSDVISLEKWFKFKSKIFEQLKREVLMDLIKHCTFLTMKKNSIIVQQGEKGHCFYLIIRGQVSVLIRDVLSSDADDVRGGGDAEEKLIRETDRNKLGTVVNVLKDGQSFGEIALHSDDCIRNASCVTDDVTDLIVIHRDLYYRSVSDIINADLSERLKFVETCDLFKDWANKWKKQMAASMIRESRAYEDIVVRQGQEANWLMFIVSGEVKLTTDPSLHDEQYKVLKLKWAHLMKDKESMSNSKHFSLMNWLSAKSRVAERLKSAQLSRPGPPERTLSEDLPVNKLQLSPSAVRKKTAVERKGAKKVDLCFLSQGQIFGDVELLTGMKSYYCSIVCTQPTTTIRIHRAIFDRLIKKKNSFTIHVMTRNLHKGVAPRFARPNITQNVPFAKCIIAKIHDLNMSKKAKQKLLEEESQFPHVESSSTQLTGYDWSRVKSGMSRRSFPLTKKNQENLRSSYEEGGLPNVQNDVRRDDTSPAEPRVSAYVESLVNRGTSITMENNKGSPSNGIFVKLLQVSNPMIQSQHLAIEEDECEYLMQLKRRLARQLEDFYPKPRVSQADSQGDRPQRLCQASGFQRRRSAHQGGTGGTLSARNQSSTDRKRPLTKGKNVFFSLS